MKIDSDAARRWALGLVGAVFLAGAILENVPGVKLPLGDLRLWNDWNMFAKPGAPLVSFVVGKPRDGGEGVILVNPVDRSSRLLDRLHDARQDKLHEALGRPITPMAVRQSYLARVCEAYRDRYSHLELRLRQREDAAGRLIAERTCE